MCAVILSRCIGKGSPSRYECAPTEHDAPKTKQPHFNESIVTKKGKEILHIRRLSIKSPLMPVARATAAWRALAMRRCRAENSRASYPTERPDFGGLTVISSAVLVQNGCCRLALCPSTPPNNPRRAQENTSLRLVQNHTGIRTDFLIVIS